MIKKVLLTINFVILFLYSYSQAPDNVPYGNPVPVKFNLLNIILLIVIPVLMIVFYIYFQRRKKKKKKEDK